MNTIITIYRKELHRVLYDKKMLFALYVLPILMMVLIYGVMGITAVNMQKDIAEHKSEVMILHAPSDYKKMLQNGEDSLKKTADVTYTDDEQVFERKKQKIRSGEMDLLIEFPKDFSKQVTDYQRGDPVPQVKTFYNPSEDYSSSAKDIFDENLERFRQSLLKERIGDLTDIQIFTVDTDNKENVIQDEKKAGGKMLAMILPYIVCMLLFSGVMSLGVDVFAGEKERGTIAMVLVAPVKRTQVVYGKFLALITLSAISSVIYGVGVIISFPAFAAALSEKGMKVSITPGQIVLILLLVVSLVFLYVALISICAVLAKSTKEATAYVMPAYMVVIVTGMMTMFVSGTTPTSTYAIPLYGSTMALRNILAMEADAWQVLISVAVNLLLGVGLGVCVAKAFNNERIMFDA